MNYLLGPDVVALKSELAVFDPSPVQSSVIQGQFVHYQPQHGLAKGTPIEFELPPPGDLYIDPQETVLTLAFRVRDTDNAAIEADKNYVSLSNMPLASLFQDVQLSIGDTVIEGGNFLYPYKAMFLALLEYGERAQKGQMKAWGFHKDSAGAMETVGDGNRGCRDRRALIANDRLCVVSGPLFLDLFRQPRYLLSKLGMRIKLIPADAKFVLTASRIGEHPLKTYSVEIVRAELRVRYVQPSPSVAAAHAEGLKKHNAMYPLNTLQMGTFTVTQGTSSYTRENLFQGYVPKLLIVAFVSNRAFNGSLGSNPFNFVHANVSFLGVYVNGEPCPGRPLQPNVQVDGASAEYTWLLQQLGLYMRDRDIGFSMDEYTNGYCLYAANLSPELAVGGGEAQPIKGGNVRLEMKFSAPTDAVYNVLVGGVFDRELQLTEFRDVVPSTLWK